MSDKEIRALLEAAAPGPWRWAEIDPTDPEWGACEVLSDKSYVSTMISGTENARLIAAAPDLARAVLSARAERDALCDRIAVVEGALRTMIYETTHLSGERDDGSHRCIISRATLSQARAALQSTPKEQTDE